jgi:hypothetical protein
MATFDMRLYARRGAEARVSELQGELNAIYEAFPDLRPARRGRPIGSTTRTASTRASASTSTARPGAGRKRKRRGMSAAERKAVSARMKKYWAARRKAQSGK